MPCYRYIILFLFLPLNVYAEIWNCKGRTVSVINGRNRIETTDHSAQSSDDSNTRDSLLKAIRNIEANFDQAANIKNVCNFSAVIDPQNQKTRLTWIYTLTWRTKDEAPGTSSTEIVIGVDHLEEFDSKVNQLIQKDQSPNFFVITTLCTYYCH